jgi:hypothetical protein
MPSCQVVTKAVRALGPGADPGLQGQKRGVGNPLRVAVEKVERLRATIKLHEDLGARAHDALGLTDAARTFAGQDLIRASKSPTAARARPRCSHASADRA